MDGYLLMVMANTASITPKPAVNESHAVSRHACGHLPSWNGSTEAVIAKDPHKANDTEVSLPRPILMPIDRRPVNQLGNGSNMVNATLCKAQVNQNYSERRSVWHAKISESVLARVLGVAISPSFKQPPLDLALGLLMIMGT